MAHSVRKCRSSWPQHLKVMVLYCLCHNHMGPQWCTLPVCLPRKCHYMVCKPLHFTKVIVNKIIPSITQEKFCLWFVCLLLDAKVFTIIRVPCAKKTEAGIMWLNSETLFQRQRRGGGGGGERGRRRRRSWGMRQRDIKQQLARFQRILTKVRL